MMMVYGTVLTRGGAHGVSHRPKAPRGTETFEEVLQREMATTGIRPVDVYETLLSMMDTHRAQVKLGR